MNDLRDASHIQADLLLVGGIAGVIGSIAPTVMNLVAAGVAEHDFVADTISDLGRGPHKWIMDTGFYIGSGGLVGLAVAAAHLHLGRRDWTVGILCLVGLALVTVMIGLWDDFGGGQDLSVHTRLTYVLFPLYFLGPLLMIRGLSDFGQSYRLLFAAASLLWAGLSIAFKLAPDAWDGIVEKSAVLATLLWTLPLSAFFAVTGWRAKLQPKP